MNETDLATVDGRGELAAASSFKLPESVRTELESKFGWLVSRFTELFPHFGKWGNRDHLLAYIVKQYEDGLIKTSDDALGQFEIYAARTFGLQLMDLGNAQLSFHREISEQLDNRQTMALRNIADAGAKVLKTTMEMRSEAGATMRSRTELNLRGGKEGLAGLFDDVTGSGELADREDMVAMLRGRIQSSIANSDQLDLATAPDGADRKLTTEQMRFLTAGPKDERKP